MQKHVRVEKVHSPFLGYGVFLTTAEEVKGREKRLRVRVFVDAAIIKEWVEMRNTRMGQNTTGSSVYVWKINVGFKKNGFQESPAGPNLTEIMINLIYF